MKTYNQEKKQMHFKYVTPSWIKDLRWNSSAGMLTYFAHSLATGIMSHPLGSPWACYGNIWRGI